MRSKFFALITLAVLAIGPMTTAGKAAIVTILDSGTANVGVALTPDLSTILATDFRAAATLGVVDTSTLSVLSIVFATDDSAPFPNATWGLLNLGFTELGFLTFDTATANIVNGGATYTVLADFIGGPFTDPGLDALLGQHLATFQLVDVVPLASSVVAIYAFESLVKVDEVPEPASIMLFGSGVLLLSGLRLRTRKS